MKKYILVLMLLATSSSKTNNSAEPNPNATETSEEATAFNKKILEFKLEFEKQKRRDDLLNTIAIPFKMIGKCMLGFISRGYLGKKTTNVIASTSGFIDAITALRVDFIAGAQSLALNTMPFIFGSALAYKLMPDIDKVQNTVF